MVQCCFHRDSTPSLSISPTLRCYHCLGCGAKGNITQLIAKAGSLSSAAAISELATTTTGVLPIFRTPDKKAVANYRYYNKHGNLQKEVLRYVHENGEKYFRQRRPVAGGYTWNVKGLRPMLYHEDLLRIAGTVVICEGEKDADTITNLRLQGESDLVVAVTSGGAESWDSSLAKLLADDHKRIIVLPDCDPAGERWTEAVTESLGAEGIAYEVASFAGTGHKDAAEYLSGHTVEEFIRLIGSTAVRMQDGRRVVDETTVPYAVIDGDPLVYHDITI